MAYLGVGLLLAGMMALYVRNDAFLKARGTPVAATITAIRPPILGRTYPPRGFVVVAKSTSGLEGTTSVPSDRLRGCRVGDAILASEVNGSLRLEPRPCTHS